MIQPSYQDILKYSMQGIVDGWEWLTFLRTHGRADYKVWLDANPLAICDAMQESPEGKRSYVELKSRNVPFKQYPDCLIDERKIIALRMLAQQTGDKVYLAALYPLSSKIAVWEIKPDEEYRVVEKVANVTTIRDSRPQFRQSKRMVSLPLTQATKHTHKFYQPPR